jgi:hypothetical protein
MNETLIDDVLGGAINVDHKGTKRWRYVADGLVQYMAQNEFADFFNDVINKVQEAANSWKDECQSTQ